VLVPIGQVEEHGPHLPVGTDTYIAQDVARQVAEKLQGELLYWCCRRCGRRILSTRLESGRD